MKKINIWMMLLAIAVSPLMGQEPDPANDTDEQQVEQAIDEAIGGEEEYIDEGDVMYREVISASEAEEEEPAEEEVFYEEEEAYEEDEAYEDEAAYEEDDAYEEEPYYEEEVNYQDDSRPQRREVQTLMSGSGGFGALSVGYSEINGTPSVIMGARAEWVIGHGFGLGIAGVGFASDLKPDGGYLTGDYLMGVSGGYGGLVMEPIILGWFPVHVALPVLIGAGGMTAYSTPADLWEYGDLDPYMEEYSVFFVAEVGVELEFNLVRAVRLSIFGNYRFTPDLDIKYMSGMVDPETTSSFIAADALQGWSAGVRFKFGKF